MSINIYFISGHLDLTQQEFDDHYKELIDKVLLEEKEGVRFVLGNARGCDSLALTYLLTPKGRNSVGDIIPLHGHRITVYIYAYPKQREHSIVNQYLEYEVGVCHGYDTCIERDAAMTKESTHDIVWQRSAEETKRLLGDKYDAGFITGAMKNLLRRQNPNLYLS